MKIVFMGTPRFALPALSAISAEGFDVKYAVTQQDKAKGRGNKVQFTPVKEMAMSLGITVLQPLDFDSDEFKLIESCEPDLIVVSAFGKILPKKILTLPKYGCINIHASLLPRWRGAAPIQRAVMEGDETTGITIMYMDEGLDTGDIIMSKSTEIGRKTSGQLHEELSVIGAELIISAIGRIVDGAFERTAQNQTLSTYAPPIQKKEGLLDFSLPPEKIERLVRGLDPWPGVYTFYKGDMMKIWEAFSTGVENKHEKGSVTGISDMGLEVSAGRGTLLVTEIQMPGRNRMKIKEFLRGNKIEKFHVLG